MVTCAIWALPAFGASRVPNPFFAYELGEGVPEQQARLASDVGFDGMAFDDAKLVPERLKALESVQGQLFFLWISLDIGKERLTYDANLEKSIRALSGHGTVIWLALEGKGPNAEKAAVEASRHVADLAAESNLRVALYPHYGFYLSTLKDVMRVAEEAHRSNLGVTFNLCHELRSGMQSDLYPSLERVLPRLYGVTINGAYREAKNWDGLIQPLDKGDYDVADLLRELVAMGYRGPIGLQCWGIKENPREHLARSMKTWKRISAEISARQITNR
ncbi:MAG: sugar phosphate isomerase/epimerase [Deltaproteobacteria bacterium]|nr:sugar phosphate isomerase/epimerase [Deltaproteobacteria bacterium]